MLFVFVVASVFAILPMKRHDIPFHVYISYQSVHRLYQQRMIRVDISPEMMMRYKSTTCCNLPKLTEVISDIDSSNLFVFNPS